jgi:hypothetical protein
MYTIYNVPGITVDKIWNDYEDCYNEAKMIVNYIGAKFAPIYKDTKLLTVIIKKGYNIYNFRQFNKLELEGRIKDFFILHQNGMDNYYIKLKTK